MPAVMKRILKPVGQSRLLMAFIFILIHCHGAIAQVDSTRLQQLIMEAQERSLYIFAQAINLSPYENREFHRDRTIKHIEMVEAFDLNLSMPNTEENYSYQIIDKQTIVQQQEDGSSKYTYFYLKDGRISKILRGRSVSDLYQYDRKGFLIQHGKGGELKKAKRKGKVFDWYNVQRDRLEYTATYNEQDRIGKFKTMGHFFGRYVDFEIEEYTWENGRLIGLTKTKKYKDGKPKSDFTRFDYDSQGLLSNFSTRSADSDHWYSNPMTTTITHLDKEQVKITIALKDNTIMSMTFDHFDNWIEMIHYNKTMRRTIQYRKNKRRK